MLENKPLNTDKLYTFLRELDSIPDRESVNQLRNTVDVYHKTITNESEFIKILQELNFKYPENENIEDLTSFFLGIEVIASNEFFSFENFYSLLDKLTQEKDKEAINALTTLVKADAVKKTVCYINRQDFKECLKKIYDKHGAKKEERGIVYLINAINKACSLNMKIECGDSEENIASNSPRGSSSDFFPRESPPQKKQKIKTANASIESDASEDEKSDGSEYDSPSDFVANPSEDDESEGDEYDNSSDFKNSLLPTINKPYKFHP